MNIVEQLMEAADAEKGDECGKSSAKMLRCAARTISMLHSQTDDELRKTISIIKQAANAGIKAAKRGDSDGLEIMQACLEDIAYALRVSTKKARA